MQTNRRRWLERCLLISGCVLLALYVGLRIDSYLHSREALREFQVQKQARTFGKRLEAQPIRDFNLWSPGRRKLYLESLDPDSRSPAAILRIPKIGLEVPVLEGTDELELNRGVGHIIGTAKPGGAGNVGIAGHRDGFFRGLKGIGPGDVLVLETSDSNASYLVDEVSIVEPTSVEVLRSRHTPSLTLVTCYPFYFVGDAPKRYIVHASLKSSISTTTAEAAEHTQGMKFNDQENNHE
jgi:sortase A